MYIIYAVDESSNTCVFNGGKIMSTRYKFKVGMENNINSVKKKFKFLVSMKIF